MKIERNSLCPCGSGKKYKKCCWVRDLTNQKNVNPFRSEKFLITISLGEERYKLFQIFYLKDGTICIDCPFFKDKDGALNEVILPPSREPKIDIKPFVDNGKVVSHNIKYSHHPDGRAHFSQDGKIFTKIKKQSVPYDKICGHMFTVMIEGIHYFNKVNSKKDFPHGKNKRTVINFEMPIGYLDFEREGLNFIGKLFPISYFEENLDKIPSLNKDKEMLGPKILLRNDEITVSSIMLSSLDNNPSSGYILTISPIKRKLLSNKDKPSLLFLGGFDDFKKGVDLSQETSFLIFFYPAHHFSNMDKLENIDFIKQ
ncbi:MAG: SEC-C domain-containing protein [Bacilli bacterium]|nr:SEC-C domain-containing protein [Bacilli bacterium]MDD4831927.1 SEC-C domain-containing protein [Bacilli bacterium]